MTRMVINLEADDNHKKCEAIKKLGYVIRSTDNSCFLTSKENKNLDQYMNVYFRNINEVLLVFKKELSVAGYDVVMA